MLPNPPSARAGSYLATHISPILYLLSLPSDWVNVPLPAYFALTQGFIYGLLTFAGAWCARPLLENVRGGPWWAGVFGLGLGFSGLALAGMAFPHFEFLFGGLAILFLALLLQGRWRWAMGPFGLALLVREDCGLHLFGVLFLLWGLTWMIPEWRWRRRQLGAFMGVALGYSILAIILQKLYFPGDDALRRVYLGDPLFHQVTRAMLARRVDYYLNNGKYLWVPLFILLSAAAWRRSLVLLCGVAAFLPWLVVNFVAVNDSAGELSIYYGFPLVVALIWPALTYAADPRRMTPGRAVILQAALLGASAALFWSEHGNIVAVAVETGLSPSGFRTEEYNRNRDLVRAIEGQPGAQVFDPCVAACFPRDITRANTLSSISAPAPDILVGFMGRYTYGQMLAWAGTQGPWHEYLLPGLWIYVLSKKPLPSELILADGATDLGVAGTMPNVGLAPHPGSEARREGNGGIRDDQNYDTLQEIVDGAMSAFPPGRYTLTLEVEMTSAAAADLIVCDVTTEHDPLALAKPEWAGAAYRASANPGKISLTLNCSSPADHFKIRVAKQGGAHLLIKSYTLARVGEL